MTSGDIALGQKISFYRKRAKLSQLELELEIDAAQGSISRIENGQVNPTKETLSRLATVLKLKPVEVADILGLKLATTEELILAIQRISLSLDLNTTLQTSVDIMFDLFSNYNGGILFLKVSETRLQAKTISKDIPKLGQFLKILPMRLDEIIVDTDKHDNLATETFKKRVPMQSDRLRDFSKGIIRNFLGDAIQETSGYSCGLTLPMIGTKLVGIAFFTKRNETFFSDQEIKLLSLLANQIGIAIENAQNYENLQNELKKLQNGK